MDQILDQLNGLDQELAMSLRNEYNKGLMFEEAGFLVDNENQERSALAAIVAAYQVSLARALVFFNVDNRLLVLEALPKLIQQQAIEADNFFASNRDVPRCFRELASASVEAASVAKGEVKDQTEAEFVAAVDRLCTALARVELKHALALGFADVAAAVIATALGDRLVNQLCIFDDARQKEFLESILRLLKAGTREFRAQVANFPTH